MISLKSVKWFFNSFVNFLQYITGFELKPIMNLNSSSSITTNNDDSEVTDETEFVRKLLVSSREKIAQGKPSAALEDVIEVIRRTRGLLALLTF